MVATHNGKINKSAIVRGVIEDAPNATPEEVLVETKKRFLAIPATARNGASEPTIQDVYQTKVKMHKKKKHAKKSGGVVTTLPLSPSVPVLAPAIRDEVQEIHSLSAQPLSTDLAGAVLDFIKVTATALDLLGACGGSVRKAQEIIATIDRLRLKGK